MSEDEESLIEEIIKVIITAKGDAGQNTNSKRKILPEIKVTDFSSSRDINDYVTTEEVPLPDSSNKGLLYVGNEFESEPSDLMPESFMSFLSSCKGLISDINIHSEERVDADDWIEIFDKKIEDDLKHEAEAEEKRRQDEMRMLERLRRIAERKKIRKILKPLINTIPSQDPFLSSRSCHDRVCYLPLQQLKSKLKKYLIKHPTILQSFSFSNATAQPPLSTKQAIQLLEERFNAFIKTELNESSLCLNIEGQRIDDVRNIAKKAEDSIKVKVEPVDSVKEYKLSDILKVSPKKTSEKIQRLKWKYDSKDGTLEQEKRLRFKEKISKDQSSVTMMLEEKKKVKKTKIDRSEKKRRSQKRKYMKESKEIIHVYIKGLEEVQKPSSRQEQVKPNKKFLSSQIGKPFDLAITRTIFSLTVGRNL